jgi:tRNA-modifying protein YgfZ
MSLSVLHADAAVLGEIAGRPVALRYTAIENEYGALVRGAMLVDRSYRARMSFQGDRRGETLTGLVTNDVGALAPGSGQYAAALTPRGKIIADVRLFARESELLVDVPPRAAPGWLAMVRKYVNPRATAYVDRSDALADIGLFGARAREIVATIARLDAEVLAALPAFGHVATRCDDFELMVARVPDIAVEGYELIAPVEKLARIWARAMELGATPAGLDAWELARIEAGRPEWGIDIDESTIPQEANFDDLHAISYTKGCYTGQETVARVHFRGHVNRHLRGVSYPGTTPLPRGAQLMDASDKAVGDVRSSGVSPRLGGIALAMIRREVTLGSSLRAQWEDGESIVSVLPLPFPV